jgi:DNA-binding response OmpR family regulator
VKEQAPCTVRYLIGNRAGDGMDEGFERIVVLAEGPWVGGLTSSLAALGFTVHHASRCDDARHLFELENCGLLIADVTLRDGAAVDLMRRLGPSGVSGVAITSGRSGRLRAAAVQAGFSVCVTKPVRLHRLLAAVRKL